MAVDIRLPKLHAGQQRVYESKARFKVLSCGRRYGKTSFARVALTIEALNGGICAYFAPTDKNLTKFWRRMVALLAPVTVRKDEQKKILTLVTGGEIWFWSLENFETARGGDYDFVVVDECCAVKKLKEAYNEVIRPTLIDREGRAMLLSTPKGRDFFWQLFERGRKWERDSGWQDDWPAWESFTASTFDNPFVPASETETLKKELPELTYLQEILAMFLDADGAVFRNVTAAMQAQPQEKAKDGHEYVMGVDWGRTNDYTVCVVLDITTMEVCKVERWQKIPFKVQRNRIKALDKKFDPTVILVESNSIGGPNFEVLDDDGLPVRAFTTTAITKGVIIDGLALALEHGNFTMISDPVVQGELLSYEAKTMPSGHISYSAPSGQHDDCVIALALAVHAATKNTTPKNVESFW